MSRLVSWTPIRASGPVPGSYVPRAIVYFSGCEGGRGVVGKTWEAGVTPGSELDEVYLDGKRVDLAIKANSDQGWVLVYREDHRGDIVQCMGRVDTLLLYGRVEIRRCN